MDTAEPIADVDPFHADSMGHLAEALAGPLVGGLRLEGLPFIRVPLSLPVPAARQPLVMVAPVQDLAGPQLTVSASLSNGGGAVPGPPLVFAPWTEAGSFLPLYAPPVSADTGESAAFSLDLDVRLDGAPVRPWVFVRAVLLEGLFARLLYVTTAEAARNRRAARMIRQVRAIDGAFAASLDRIGEELAVPRFTERLLYHDIDGVHGEITSIADVEPDSSYRSRLKLYRPALTPTRAALLDRLNGAGNALQLAPNQSFDVLEEPNPLLTAVHLVSVGATAAEATQTRHNFLAWIRDAILLDPTQPTPPVRYMSSSARAAEDQLRARLNTRLSFVAGSSRCLAPLLARALDRLHRLLQAGGFQTPIAIRRCQEDDGGSRYELGLGVEIDQPSAADLLAIQVGLAGLNVAALQDHEVASIARSLSSVLAAAGAGDAPQTWLRVLDACGLRTVHPTAAGRIYLSHFSVGGLAVTGPHDLTSAQAVAGVTLRADLFPPQDGVLTNVLSNALTQSAAQWGNPGWTLLSAANAPALWQAAVVPAQAFATNLEVLGLPVVGNPADFASALALIPDGLTATLRLSGAYAALLLTVGQQTQQVQQAWTRLGQLRDLLTANGAAALAVAPAGADVMLVVSAIGLPVGGANLTGRRTVGFRWNAIPLSQEADAHTTPIGARSQFLASQSGLCAVMVLGYERVGLTDPFEIRVTLPDGVLLGLDQYEYLMNLLGHVHPLGVEVNTWDLRQKHVQLDQNGPQRPLSPQASRTFRPYRRRRYAGVATPPSGS